MLKVGATLPCPLIYVVYAFNYFRKSANIKTFLFELSFGKSADIQLIPNSLNPLQYGSDLNLAHMRHTCSPLTDVVCSSIEWD